MTVILKGSDFIFQEQFLSLQVMQFDGITRRVRFLFMYQNVDLGVAFLEGLDSLLQSHASLRLFYVEPQEGGYSITKIRQSVAETALLSRKTESCSLGIGLIFPNKSYELVKNL